MENSLIELLESFGYPVMRQGSLAPDESYPNTFFTFWNNDEIGESYYDNDVISINYSFSVSIYSIDPLIAYNLLRQAKTLLKSNGWIVPEFGYDVPSDEITHVGRGMQIEFLNFEN